MLSIVVAIANNNVIGGNNKLLWRFPADLKRFKTLTTTSSRTIIMGRKTFESLPKMLPERKHIILTRNMDFKLQEENANTKIIANNETDNAKVIHDISEIESYINSELEYFIIGGGEIYNLLLPYCNKMYITRIYENFDGDTLFPQYDNTHWTLIDEVSGTIDDKNTLKHTFLTFIRK